MTEAQRDHDARRSLTPRPRVLGRAVRASVGAATVASATLSAGLAVLWIRSYFVSESWSTTADRRYVARSSGGVIVLERQWTTAAEHDEPGDLDTAIRNGAMPFTFAAIGLTPSHCSEAGPIQRFRSWVHIEPGPAGGTWPPARRWGVGWDFEPAPIMGFNTTLRPGAPSANGAAKVTHVRFRGTVAQRVRVPIGVCTAAFALVPIGRLVRSMVRRRPLPGHCRRCGYDLRASPGRCPECGRAADPGGAGG